MKTVLVITYYWPPSGGSGVQRWLKFTRYLEEFGWHAVVVTPENPQFDSRDVSLESEVHPDTEVLKLPIWEPYHLVQRLKGGGSLQQGSTSGGTSAWMKAIRGNLTLPDPRIFWKKPVVRFLKEYLKKRNIDAIVTTGPPHSMHLIGRKLHRKFNIPWLADFRDPWSTWDMLNEFRTTAMARRIHEKLESSVVGEADAVVTVSNSWAKEMEETHKKEVHVLTNGFDRDDFEGGLDFRPEKFRLMHFGLINEFRHVPVFWETLSDISENNPAFANDLEVHLYGVMDAEIAEYFKSECPVADKVQVHPAISHEAVLKKYFAAAVLLLFMNRSENSSGHIPGKLFEYLAVGRPVLGTGDSAGDCAEILRSTGAGSVVSWDDAPAIKHAILALYESFKRGEEVATSNVSAYERRSITSELAALLNRISQDAAHTI